MCDNKLSFTFSASARVVEQKREKYKTRPTYAGAARAPRTQSSVHREGVFLFFSLGLYNQRLCGGVYKKKLFEFLRALKKITTSTKAPMTKKDAFPMHRGWLGATWVIF